MGVVTHPNITKFSIQAAHGHSSVLL